MTKEDKIKAFSMKIDGYTYEEIAREFGVAKQYICSILTSPGKEKTYEKIIYPRIADWLRKNNLSMTKFAIKLYPEKTVKNAQSTSSRKMRGKTELNKSDIDRILEVTGMTYEEAFERREE